MWVSVKVLVTRLPETLPILLNHWICASHGATKHNSITRKWEVSIQLFEAHTSRPHLGCWQLIINIWSCTQINTVLSVQNEDSNSTEVKICPGGWSVYGIGIPLYHPHSDYAHTDIFLNCSIPERLFDLVIGIN